MKDEWLYVKVSGRVADNANTYDIYSMIYENLINQIGSNKRLPKYWLYYLVREDSISDRITFKFPVDQLIEQVEGLEKQEMFGFS